MLSPASQDILQGHTALGPPQAVTAPAVSSQLLCSPLQPNRGAQADASHLMGLFWEQFENPGPPLSFCASCPKTSSTKPRRTKFSSVEEALQKRPQSLKNEPKEERQPKATQLSPAGEENKK
ncbi:hypothetical protein EK904_010551, partial [Melospiza melodia maxima]